MKRTLFYAALLVALLGAIALISARAQAQEAVAVITEIKLNRGDVQIRLPGKKGWEKPTLLQSLYAGTQIQASADATAVVLFMEGTRTVTVDEKNSPFEVKPADAKAGQASGWEVVRFLLGKKRPASYVPVAGRGGKQPPVLVSPRNTKLITDLPMLQWMGMERQPGTVRVYGPDGQVWAAKNISLTQIKYPSSAPRLKPGVEYAWTIEKKGFPVEKARFKILAPEGGKAVQEKLVSLQNASSVPKTTLAILKAGLLVSHELYHEAREALVEAMNGDPDEPTLHFLLGEIYEKTGLKNLAFEEYSESEFLLKKRQ